MTIQHTCSGGPTDPDSNVIVITKDDLTCQACLDDVPYSDGTLPSEDGRLLVDPIESADHLDPIRYVDAGPRAEYTAALAHDIAANLTAKADAGARLFFALYHHPKAIELVKSEFMSKGLQKAWADASRAFLPGRPS